MQTRKLFLGLKLYKIPSELNYFQHQKNRTLQKADVLNPIINFSNKPEDVCVYLLMFNINALEKSDDIFPDYCHLDESCSSCVSASDDPEFLPKLVSIMCSYFQSAFTFINGSTEYISMCKNNVLTREMIRQRG